MPAAHVAAAQAASLVGAVCVAQRANVTHRMRYGWRAWAWREAQVQVWLFSLSLSLCATGNVS